MSVTTMVQRWSNDGPTMVQRWSNDGPLSDIVSTPTSLTTDRSSFGSPDKIIIMLGRVIRFMCDQSCYWLYLIALQHANIGYILSRYCMRFITDIITVLLFYCIHLMYKILFASNLIQIITNSMCCIV